MCVAFNNKSNNICSSQESEFEITTEKMAIDPTTTKPRACRRRSSKSKRPRTYVEHNYSDHYNDPIFVPGEKDDETEEAPKRRGPRGGVVVPFPERLYAMLNQAEQDGFEDVVSWSIHGRCFTVHQPKRFVDEVMPTFFKQSKLTSFQRQVNLYGFRRLTAGKDRGAYYHELFLRGRPDLHRKLVRIRVKGTGFKSAASPATEPNFFNYQPCVEGAVQNLTNTKAQLEAEVQKEPEMPPILPTVEPMPPIVPTVEPISCSSFSASPVLDSWKPLSAPPKVISAPPKMIVTPQLKPREAPSLANVFGEMDTSNNPTQLWNLKRESSAFMSLSSMAKDIVGRPTSATELKIEPTPITPESNGRQLITSELQQVLATVSPVESPSPSAFPSMLPSTHPGLSVVPLSPAALTDVVDSCADHFQDSIQALLASDFGDFTVDHTTMLECRNPEMDTDCAVDPLLLLDDVVSTHYTPF